MALVTGASSGIGAATCDALARDGWFVIAAARRSDRIEAVANRTRGTAVVLDVTDQDSVDRLAQAIPRLDLLVNNAGGAKGLDPVVEADLDGWQWMYDTNVLGTLRVTKALVGKLTEADGLVVNVCSVAGHDPYPGGAGYNAAKHGVAAMTRVLRMETADTTLRVTEINPGRVWTEEFSLVRFDGDQARADAVYADHLNLTAGDVSETIRWVASLPSHVNIDSLTVRPRDQV